MKRMMMMVALAAFLVAALSVSALSAFAAGNSLEQQCPGEKEKQEGGGFACPTENTNPGGATNPTAVEQQATPEEETVTSSPGGGGGQNGEKIAKEDRVVGCGGANRSC
jgi:ABC-type glycerol-3-phosphate transport system substrate-binding protein